MNSEMWFHGIEIVIQSGVLITILTITWKMSSVFADFRMVKEKQEEHVEDDKIQFQIIEANLGRLQQAVARIEGRLGSGD